MGSEARIVALCVAGALLTACGWQPGQSGFGQSAVAKDSAAVTRISSAGIASVRYRWEDPNTWKVVDREGDTLVIDPSVQPKSLDFTAQVNLQRLQAVIDSFGAPRSWLSVSFRSESELRAKEAEMAARLRTRGLDYDPTTGTIGVELDWVVARSKADLFATTAGLHDLAARAGYTDARGLHGVIASLVQGMDYAIPPSSRTLSDGTTVETCGVTMPLETLYEGKGDCDTRALLLATLLANLERTGVIFLMGNDHMFVGIRGPARQHDRFVRIQGVTYVLVELTDNFPIGVIPNEQWHGVQRSLFKVSRVVE